MERSLQAVYQFGHFLVDPARAALIKDGTEYYLRSKTWKVLYYLLEHRDRVVGKQELLDEIWPGTTVTDDVLTQCVSDLRKALGDDARNPIYLRTIPKQGFRFIAPVDTVVPVPLEPAAASVKPPPAKVSMNRWVGMAAALLSLAVISPAIWNSVNKPQGGALAGKSTVAVMPFESRSPITELEWLRDGLPDMLMASLARSPKLSILPREQVLKLSSRSQEHGRLDVSAALNNARRSRVQILLTGAFASLGAAIRVDIQLYEVAGGSLLASETLTVDRADDLLMRLDGLAVRAALVLKAPLRFEHAGAGAEARTSNLEAYGLYTLGVSRAEQFHSMEAVSLFERALKLDPSFDMARARIGYAYAFSAGDNARGLPYLREAIKGAERMNGRDLLFVTAWHAFSKGDTEASIQAYRQILKEYPAEISAYVALSRMLRGDQRFGEAREVLLQALTIDPEWGDLHNLLAGIEFILGHTDRAIESAKRFTELAPMEPNAHDSLGMIYQRSGRYREALDSFQRALSIHPGFEPAVFHVGNTMVDLGRYAEALVQFRKANKNASDEIQRARAVLAAAWVLWKSGDYAAALRELPPVGSTAVLMRRVIALDERPVKAPPVTASALDVTPHANARGARITRRHEYVLLGTINRLTGNSAQAIEHMKTALRETPPYWMHADFEECLAETYLALDRLDEAITEYRRVLQKNPNRALTRHGLAMALEKKGERAEAREQLVELMKLWKDADAELPLRKDAVRRLETVLAARSSR